MSLFRLYGLYGLYRPGNQRVIKSCQFVLKIARRLRVSECRVMLASTLPSGSKLDENLVNCC